VPRSHGPILTYGVKTDTGYGYRQMPWLYGKRAHREPEGLAPVDHYGRALVSGSLSAIPRRSHVRLFVQCPDCQTYLPQEEGTGRYEGREVMPGHTCWIGNQVVIVEARPIDQLEAWLRLFDPFNMPGRTNPSSS
jgi:hypothetical protein